nr:nephrin-like isoform X2 [Crassostrea virginica]
MNLTCTTSASNPQANITWYKSLDNITSQSTSTTEEVGGLARTISSLQSIVGKEDNGKRIYCRASNTPNQAVTSNLQSINVLFPVTSVTLTPTSITVADGQQMNLTCTTSASNPQANITWYKSFVDITSQSTSTTEEVGGLARTVSSLQSIVGKEDNGKRIYCRASNSPNQAVTSNVQSINVQLPVISVTLTPTSITVTDGQQMNLTCTTSASNPQANITWYMSTVDITSQSTSTTEEVGGLARTISSLQSIVGKEDNGKQINCRASNTPNQAVTSNLQSINVLYKPSIEKRDFMVVNETERVVLTREIASNPLANVSWFDGQELFKSEIAVSTTTFIIEKTRCTDTKNFTLTASNALQRNVTSFAELRVNCGPIPDVRNITLWVDEDNNFAFLTKIIAYPEPRFALLFENGLQPNGIKDSMTMNTVNNFTLYFYKTAVKQTDYGTYNLHINNTFGETTVFINVLMQRKPNKPVISKVSCKLRNAQIQWESSFNGGAIQTFIALATIAQHTVSRSESVCDKGESKIHFTQLQNLQPSTKYVLYIVALNKHGNSSSEKRECKTLDDEASNQIPVIAGSTLGSLGLVAMILFTMLLLQKRYRCVIKLEKRTRGKESPKTEKETHYTTITEQENTERSLYDELTQNRDQYESVLMKGREEGDMKTYEQLQKTKHIDKQLPFDAKKKDNRATGSTTPLHEQPSQGTASEYSEYTNTSFTE